MLNSTPVALIVGCMLGVLAGLGVGGGSLLILWLSIVIGLDPNTAKVINLLFFIPSAIISSTFHWHNGKLNISLTITAAVAGCISAALFSILSKEIDVQILKKLMGALLIITGLIELFQKRPQKS